MTFITMPTAFTAFDYTVGWICALPIELVAVTALLDEEHCIDGDQNPKPSGDGYAYTFGRIGRYNIVIVAPPGIPFTTWSSNDMANNLKNSFPNVRLAVSVGIGGGAPLVNCNDELDRDIRVGDIVVGTRVVQYDMGSSLKGKLFEIDEYHDPPPCSLLEAVDALSAQLARVRNKIDEEMRIAAAKWNFSLPDQDLLFESSYVHPSPGVECLRCCNIADHTVRRLARTEQHGKVQVHYGTIGSAEQVVKNAAVRDRIATDHDVLCFEMEGGVMNSLPSLVIRGICDYADTHVDNAWQGYAAMNAAVYAKELLLSLHLVRQAAKSDHRGAGRMQELYSDLGSVGWDEIRSHRYLSRTDLEHWLAAPSPEIDFRSARDRREPGTARWILKSETFLKWINSDIRHLWVHGIAGCGKSVLSASIVENIRSYKTKNYGIGCSFFFFSFSDHSKQSHIDCLRSMIQQLYAYRSIPAALEQLCMKNKSSEEACLDIEKDLESILFDEIRSYKKFLLVLDGLDECPHPGPRERLLTWLLALSTALPMLQVCATSRYSEDIQTCLAKMRFHSLSMMTGSLTADISRFVVSQLDQHQKLGSLSTNVKMQIRDNLVSRANNVFLWVSLAVNELTWLWSTQPSYIEKALGSLPSNLEDTYESVLQRFRETAYDDAPALLQWMTYCRRPLTFLELSETRIIRWQARNACVSFKDRGHVDDITKIFSNLNMVRKLQDKPTCAFKSNVEYKDNDDNPTLNDVFGHTASSLSFACLIHYSAKEFITKGQVRAGRLRPAGLYVSQGQQILAHMCVCYLMHYAETKSITKTPQDLEDFPLLQYAATSWYTHCQETDDVDKEVEFLQSGAFSMSLLIYDPVTPWRKPFEEQTEYKSEGIRTPLFYAAWLGLHSIVRELIRAEVSINGHDKDHNNALHVAADKGYERIVRLLLGAGANVNDQSSPAGYTPLHLAARNGNDAVVMVLLDAGAYLDAEGSLDGCTPLHLAFIRQHRSTADKLIKAAARVEAIYANIEEKWIKCIADGMHTLGLLYCDQHRLDEAEQMFLLALQGYEQSLGRAHISTLKFINNLGILYQNQNKLALAAEMYQRALEGYAGRSGYESSILKTTNNLGTVYSDQGRSELAEAAYKRAISGYSEMLGSDAPLTLETINNLASLYASYGNLNAAEHLFLQNMRAYTSTLGAKHLATLSTINNLGLLYGKQGRLSEAERMLFQALEGRRECLGDLHLSTLHTASNLGGIYSVQNRLLEAEKLLLYVLHGYEKNLGSKNIETYIPALDTFWALGNLYSKHRPDLARSRYLKALCGYEIVRGRSSKAYVALSKQLDQLEISSAILEQFNNIKMEDVQTFAPCL